MKTAPFVKHYKTAALRPGDDTISAPFEIAVCKGVYAFARHPDHGGEIYQTLADLCAVYRLQISEVLACDYY